MKKIGYNLLICFGLVMIAGAIIQIDKGESKNSLLVDLILVSIFGILPIFFGFRMLGNIKTQAKRNQNNEVESILIREAQSNGGKITIAEAVIALKKSLTETKIILDKMQAQSIFEIALSDDGTLYYVICQILDSNESKSGQINRI